ncbi:unnamed protein product [Clonostachys rhizophaga]|uniref:Uncharacterized protein n=1 Tax=Clonostachys rhizophaga TaxID=160324 RepID=A0A9N9ZAH6_9HYPO|nr:unnamed protein product [Clonostachys rhizophaga]
MDGDETDYETISSAESEADEHVADEQEADEHEAEPGTPVSPGSNAENPFVVDDDPSLADEPNLADEPPLFVEDAPQFVEEVTDGDYVNDEDGQSSGSQSSSNESESEDSQTDASSEGQDQNNVFDSDAEEPPWSLVHCQEFCQPHWQRIHNKSYRRKCRIIRLTQEYRRVQRENRELRAEVEDLRARLAARRQVRGRYKATWYQLYRLRDNRQNMPNGRAISWAQIYKKSCLEGNMSQLLTFVHPRLKLRPPCPRDEQSTPRDEQNTTRTEEEPFVSWVWARLPAGVQLEVLRHLLVFTDGPIHAISRLDPYNEPPQPPRNCLGKISYLHRFHIGIRSVSLTYALNPQKVLAPLRGRFAKGIGSRLQRVQSISLLWKGSQYLTFKPTEHGHWSSRRTHPLLWLSEAKHLLNVEFFLQESHPEVMRRKHEPRALINHMAEKTNLQPSYRLNRDLRTLQGLDYIICLRGLKKVDFFDFDRWKSNGVIEQVRDYRFVMHVKNNVCRSKAPHDAETSEIRNLAPTVPGYVMESGDWDALERFLTKHFGIQTEQIPLQRGYAPVRSQPVSTFIVIDSDSEDDSDSRSSVRFGSGSGILEERQSMSSATSAIEEDRSNPGSEQPMASTESNAGSLDEVMDFDVIDPADDEMSDNDEDGDDLGDAMDLGE